MSRLYSLRPFAPLVLACTLICMASYFLPRKFRRQPRPAPPKLSLYTSPEFKLPGTGAIKTRIQVLVPTDWVVHFRSNRLGQAVENVVLAGPPSTRPEGDGSLSVQYGLQHINSQPDGRMDVHRPPTGMCSAMRFLDDHGPCSVTYHRLDRAEFEATYRDVCNSVKVVQASP